MGVNMKRSFITIYVVLFVVLLTGCVAKEGSTDMPLFSNVKTVGKDILISDITDFYYTEENINYNAYYQRYRFYVEDGKHIFFHETRKRKDDYGPCTEDDTTLTGTIELTDDKWSEFTELVSGGTVKARKDSADAGGTGPWLYLYWKNDKGKYQQFAFDSYNTLAEFEAFCFELTSADVASDTTTGLTPEDIIDHSEDTGENRDALMPEDEDENVEENVAHAIINPMGESLKERIDVPAGYVRTPEAEGSLGDFLRNYRLLPDGSPVLLYDGRVKTTDSTVCVFDMYLGDKDLQQCADSVIRVYAEYMRATGMEEKIAFHFVNGFLCDWTSYKNGKRIFVNGNDVSWKSGSNVTDSDEAFEKYLETVFNYASTLSVERESEPIDITEIQIGDIFIKGGSPGHVVMVVDTCECDGKKAFLLAQGYMPAQQFHVLKNKPDDPWYYAEEVTYPFRTPEYVFDEGSLMRPNYL